MSQYMQNHFTVIYLASGYSRRFGKENKLLESFGEKPLFLHGLDTIFEVKQKTEGSLEIDPVIVTQYDRIKTYANRYDFTVVEPENAKEGVASTIKSGVKAAKESTQHYIIFPADQPLLSSFTVEKLMEGYLHSKKHLACITDGVVTGYPIIFSKEFEEELLHLTGEQGGKRILMRHTEDAFFLNAPEIELKSIDRKEELCDLSEEQ